MSTQDIYFSCKNALDNYSKLERSAKKRFESNYSDLVEKNIIQAEELFTDYMESFTNEQSLFNSMEEFKENYEGNIDDLKMKKLLPLKVDKLESVLNRFVNLSEEEKQDYANVFKEICKLNTQAAYKIYESYELVFNREKRLREAKDLNWNLIKGHRKQTQFGCQFTQIEKNATNVIYSKINDTLSPAQKANVKTILVIGETGNGKSTYLNVMANYLYGITFSDSGRIKIIVENPVQKASSYTTSVTAYTMIPKKERCTFPIQLIDTPGFGDTRGIKYDKINSDLICQFIKDNVEQIHAICFIIKSSTNKVTIIQEYIIQQIFGIFGKDVQENIIGIFTFADHREPQALQTLQQAKVEINRHFKFNNLSFGQSASASSMSENEDDTKMTEYYWNMAQSSFDSFFEYIGKITPVSMKDTKTVIKEKQNLNVQIIALQGKINEGIKQRNILEYNYNAFIKNYDMIVSNKNFKTKIKNLKKVQRKTQPGVYTTNCLNCSYTVCHRPCLIPDDDSKIHCAAMKQGKCTVCTPHCDWTMHRNLGYYYEEIEEEVETTLENTKKNYDKGVSDSKAIDIKLKDIMNSTKLVTADIIDCINKCTFSLNELDRIALRTIKVDISDYMEMMIQTENEQKTMGYLERIDQIKKVKEQYKLLPNLKDKEKIFSTVEIGKMVTDIEKKQKLLNDAKKP